MLPKAITRVSCVALYQLLLFGSRNVANQSRSRRNCVRNGVKLAGLVSIGLGDTKLVPHKKSLKDVTNMSDRLYQNGMYKESFAVLEEYQQTENSDILWRQARAMYKFAKASKDKATMRKILTKAVQKNNEALKLDETNSEVHVWMTVLLLTFIDCDGIMAALKYMNKAYIHAKTAIDCDPNDPWAWFTISAYEFELASLPSLTKKIVLKVFSVTPAASYDKALEGFQQAEKVQPGFAVTNWLMMAKCFIALKQVDEAKTFLNRIINSKLRNDDDEASKQAAEKLMQNLTNSTDVVK